MRPILFHIGSVPIRSYGFMVFVGFVIALWFTRRAAAIRFSGAEGETRRRGDDEKGRERRKKVRGTRPIVPDDVSNVALIGLWVGILGARLLFVAMDWKEYRNNPGDILKVWQGGMTAYGAIIFGLLYMAWYCRRQNISFLQMADLSAPAIAFVYAIGRIGCFLNGCCYGAPCNGWYCVVFWRDGHPELGRTPPSHPAQLYSTLMNLVIFSILWFWYRRPHKRGEVFLGYVALFFVYRTVYEQFRKGFTADVFIFGLTHAQLFNLICLPVVLYLLYLVRKRRDGVVDDWPDGADELPKNSEPVAAASAPVPNA